MANERHLAILRAGINDWNRWRAESDESPDLQGANLRGADLSGANLYNANLSEANLRGAKLFGAHLRHANLRKANLSEADLADAYLGNADLRDANLDLAIIRYAYLGDANLGNANLCGANLSGAHLVAANLSGTDVREANFQSAIAMRTIFAALDLREAKNLEAVTHGGPSEISISTLIRSEGNMPKAFLRGCGVPDMFIDYIGTLMKRPIQYYSCFISYSSKDQSFADRLYADLQAKGVRCWFAPHDVLGGKKLHEQIDEAIRVYDKLLVVLSENSIHSEWVGTELAKARKRESKEKRQMLFPVRLVDFNTLRDWECFDADTGKDTANELREYYIPDFSRWKEDTSAYEAELEKLLEGLKAINRD